MRQPQHSDKITTVVCCDTCRYNLWIMLPSVNLGHRDHPPPIWWLLPFDIKCRLLSDLLSSYVDVPAGWQPGQRLPLRCDDYWFGRLVHACKILPGVWFLSVRGPDGLLSLFCKGLTTEDVIDSTGRTLRQAIGSLYYPPDRECALATPNSVCAWLH